MEIVMKISRAVEKLGIQVVKEGFYRPSKYNFTVNENGKVLIYNLFTRGMICVNEEEKCVFDGKTVVESPKEVSELIRFLIENYYFVPEEMDEQSVYRDFSSLIYTMDQKREITSYTVLTTTACNARCFYCFEQDFIPVSMTKQTARDLACYMIQHCGGKELSLHWFGGEPLCNIMAIDLICNELDAAGCAFHSNITSNGYAFTEELAVRAKNQWKVNFVQITLDGMAEEHNRRKNFYGVDKNPFARIIKNIHLLLAHDITVSIRINFDPDNIESVRQLLPFLKNEFGGEKNLVIYPAKIFDDCGTWKTDRTRIEEQKMNECFAEFTNFLAEARFLRNKAASNAYKYYHCGANNIHHRTISPEGRFLACHNLSASLSYGSIYDGITDKETYDLWMKKDEVRKQCDGCPMLPECTSFSQCPNIKKNCREEKSFALNKSVCERYQRFCEGKK